ncbi:hypothetical protein D3C73_1080890 [compost metagenome]
MFSAAIGQRYVLAGTVDPFDLHAQPHFHAVGLQFGRISHGQSLGSGAADSEFSHHDAVIGSFAFLPDDQQLHQPGADSGEQFVHEPGSDRPESNNNNALAHDASLTCSGSRVPSGTV